LVERSTAETLAQEIAGTIGRGHSGNPWITLSWAQSLDGAITARRGTPTTLSGDESMELTHRLRAMYGAILVGVGTILSDDPRLTTRGVPGNSPRPVVLDRELRTPPTARLFGDGYRQPIVFHSNDVPAERVATLTAAGAVCEALDDTGPGGLSAAMARLTAHGVDTLMVEGGGAVLAAFLAAGLAELLVVTVAPVVMGGYRPFFGGDGATDVAAPGRGAVRIASPRYAYLGDDLIAFGAPMRGASASGLPS